ncbi:spindle and kinetochore-associated protein 1-like [Labrus mixtus]|uniref:spindle and kinetochore-associated protein 1-like n=1 Tax=Labrus mixtus TaxID=508554 RepID=UPI0029C06952|nr:spindle and kinetochore-associated protein 1-like [Labrus mixtus]
MVLRDPVVLVVEGGGGGGEEEEEERRGGESVMCASVTLCLVSCVLSKEEEEEERRGEEERRRGGGGGGVCDVYIREMDFITVSEFDSIPQYMRGRVSYEQLNAAVQSINISVTAKYKILHQSVKSLNNHSCKLQQRFKEQESNDTRGHLFVVEDDFREFSQVKMDKHFQGILSMLRHCQRVKER